VDPPTRAQLKLVLVNRVKLASGCGCLSSVRRLHCLDELPHIAARIVIRERGFVTVMLRIKSDRSVPGLLEPIQEWAQVKCPLVVLAELCRQLPPCRVSFEVARAVREVQKEPQFNARI